MSRLKEISEFVKQQSNDLTTARDNYHKTTDNIAKIICLSIAFISLLVGVIGSIAYTVIDNPFIKVATLVFLAALGIYEIRNKIRNLIRLNTETIVVEGQYISTILLMGVDRLLQVNNANEQATDTTKPEN